MCVWTFVYETVGIHRCQKKIIGFPEDYKWT